MCSFTIQIILECCMIIASLTALLPHVQDLQLDNPDAAHLLSLFLGRAIVDEALPPSFLAAVLPSLENHSEGVNVVQSTGKDCHSKYTRCTLLDHLVQRKICVETAIPLCLSTHTLRSKPSSHAHELYMSSTSRQDFDLL